ncbi:hypothetical protein GCM10008955_41770 [Deinococcus malanensis]|uniref:Transposase n=1 Tax=Deinococcus malanensis TaxID=1706855 RepID=A0ABQ2F3A2_9DEIO|nr:hypothetical protein [Deinococcus malanensis]GGK43677.1 hypothetical protein GCM10008955_41770 [Deinococcus malanensis]
MKRLVQRSRSFELLCGLTLNEFGTLAQQLEPLWLRAHRTSLLRDGRQRRIGAGYTGLEKLCPKHEVIVPLMRRVLTGSQVFMIVDG